MPERQRVAHGGTYKFADPKFCACVYVGGANEYAALQKLRADRIAERERILGRSSVQGAPADRALWSAWKPEGLDAVPAPVARTDTPNPDRMPTVP